MPVTEPKPEREPSTDFYLRDQHSRINRLQAELNEQLCQENLRAPWRIVLFGMTAGAAFFAAGMGFSAALMRLHGG